MDDFGLHCAGCGETFLSVHDFYYHKCSGPWGKTGYFYSRAELQKIWPTDKEQPMGNAYLAIVQTRQKDDGLIADWVTVWGPELIEIGSDDHASMVERIAFHKAALTEDQLKRARCPVVTFRPVS